MFIVALTGDVGAGKSTLSRIWRGMGANVINSDEVAKRQWNTPEAMLRASDRWGPDVAR
ncbi:MAG: dephospho-CoA kinase, partial [Synergistaceae bacterium]|nr:dephospho-CoA kinase [Synergistaceae bacterium]